MLDRLNYYIGKWMPLITPLSVALGVLAYTNLHSLSFLVPWLFAFMTFVGSLKSNFKSLQNTVLHPFPLLLTLVVLHVITPLWAFTMGHLFFPNDPFTVTGMTLALVVPTGITSMIWVSMYKGNIPLTLSIILIDTLLSPFIVPFSMSMLAGETVEMQPLEMMKGLFFMVVLPSLLAMLVNQFSARARIEKMSRTLSPFSKLTLPAVIMINSSAIAPYLRHIDAKLLGILGTILFIVLAGYLFSWGLAALFKQTRENVVAIIYTGGMRNISAGTVIAVSFFPAQVAVPVVFCMLFQQVLAAFHGYLLTAFYNRRTLFAKNVNH
ncbi:bile acid:sodium symporter family protein [Priestia endophytica]|uniref:bile acid:sodium symporter family protein n=1 Tax=Priestia endophytica TaxID=135735 RepID=UPI00204257DE|nr:bile acid:sodium symporter family protein [Priestia endophytica]MCM3538051.1 bile acid:sodium symporter family protein [Priestia endophytica]